ncbi:MAG: hypothetical protein PHZ11_04725 [Desulfitobacteriaceae bacterium]|nr:hypothetical protein [Desulfitobacteriaceae bacterium]MDD4401169.1 hypothetical protein [Desulfitobacteriaceae bacterium]
MMPTTQVSVALSTANVDGAIKPSSSSKEAVILTKEITFVPSQDMLEITFVVKTDILNNSAQENPLAHTLSGSADSHLINKQCIIVEKVFASCQQRKCIPAFTVALPIGIPPFTFISITFRNGVIVQPTIIITPIPSRPNLFRVQFTIQIPYTLSFKDSVGQTFTLTGILSDISNDIVMYFPPLSPEFDINLRVETRTEIIAGPFYLSTTAQLSIGSFIVTKVTGLVQLLIPSFGYCPEPRECEESQPQKQCVDFLKPD